MEDSDNVLKALRGFREEKPETFPDELETYIGRIASTGETLFPWHEVKEVFIHKMQLSIDQFIEDESQSDKAVPLPNVENVSCEEMKTRIMRKINDFVSAPFTIQRLAELVMYPRKHYKKANKWLRGLEKNVNVVSTVDPFGTKIVNESKLVNGVDIRNGLDESVMQSPERTLLPPPPVNSPATAIPGWFNVAGNGDGWPASAAAASTTNNASSNSSDSGDGGAKTSDADVESSKSGAVPMQNGTKRLKTHHVSTAVVSEAGDAETVTTTATTTAAASDSTSDAAGVTPAEENTEEASSDSVSSEASEASSSSEPSDSTPATTEAAQPAVETSSEDSEKSMDADTTTTTTTTTTPASSSTSSNPSDDQPSSETTTVQPQDSEAEMAQPASSDDATTETPPSTEDAGEVSTSDNSNSEERLAQSPEKDDAISNEPAASQSVETSDEPNEHTTTTTTTEDQKDLPMDQTGDSEAETTTPTTETKETDSSDTKPEAVDSSESSEQSMETD